MADTFNPLHQDMQPFPQMGSRMVNPETGMLERPWYHLLISLWLRQGGNASKLSDAVFVKQQPIPGAEVSFYNAQTGDLVVGSVTSSSGTFDPSVLSSIPEDQAEEEIWKPWMTLLSGGETEESWPLPWMFFPLDDQAAAAVNIQTGAAYTLAAEDIGQTLYFTSAAAVTLTIPPGLPIGTCWVIQGGAGQVTFTPTAPAAVTSRPGFTKTAGHGAVCALLAPVQDTFFLFGDGA